VNFNNKCLKTKIEQISHYTIAGMFNWADFDLHFHFKSLSAIFSFYISVHFVLFFNDF